jgi:Calx-beta domain-containing protein
LPMPQPERAAPPPVAAGPAPAAAPAPARFSFVQDALNVREGDVAARITIRRSGDLSKAADVSWWTQDGTAVADADYADLGARIERFAPGEASRTVFVPLTNDSVREPMKSFMVVLGRGQGEIVARARVDISDDD